MSTSEEKRTIAIYAERSGYATQAVSADVAASCTGNAESAAKLKDAQKIIFTGDIEQEINFDGSEDLIVDVTVKSAESAACDSSGKNIAETYATKEELNAFARIEAVAAACVSRTELIEDYATKAELPSCKFSVEKFNGVPYLVVESEGKKYRFSGVEV